MDEPAVLNYEIIERKVELAGVRDQIRALVERAQTLQEEILRRSRQFSYTRRTRSRRS